MVHGAPNRFFQPMQAPRQSPYSPPPFQQMGQQRRNPGFGLNQRGPQDGQKKEGLIGKILGRSKQKQASPQNMFGPPPSFQAKKEANRSSGGGILEALKKPDGITNMLTNTQKVLQAAEQVTPMIQQYGPMVKNIPAMWNVVRALGSSESKDEKKKESAQIKPASTTINTDESATPATQTNDIILPDPPKEDTKPVQRKKASSGPKLYI